MGEELACICLCILFSAYLIPSCFYLIPFVWFPIVLISLYSGTLLYSSRYNARSDKLLQGYYSPALPWADYEPAKTKHNKKTTY